MLTVNQSYEKIRLETAFLNTCTIEDVQKCCFQLKDKDFQRSKTANSVA